jgi:hypothetical protein
MRKRLWIGAQALLIHGLSSRRDRNIRDMRETGTLTQA